MINTQELLATLQSKGYLDRYFNQAFDDKYLAYFLKPKSIHGVLHAKRVLLLSLALSHLNKLNQADTDIMVKASLYHDIGRTGDGVCYVHGRDSFQKGICAGLFSGDINEENEILRYILVNHCLHDHKMESLDAYIIADRDRAVRLLRLFKDSDGLDRVRLYDLDVDRLRYPVARELVQFAEYLLDEIS